MGDVICGEAGSLLQAGWWLSAPEIVEQCRRSQVGGSRSFHRYKFAEGSLVLDCDDEALSRRFREIYPEGSDQRGAAADPNQVTCTVRSHRDLPVAAVIFEDPEPLDAFAFCRTLFPDRGYIEGPAGSPGWRTIATRDNSEQPMVALHDNLALVDRNQLWQPFIANYAVNRVLRLQHDILFFHGASIAIGGRGVMIVGPKASGKTTTSMTLASRGHNFLGDEMAAIHRNTREMFPFRRAASVRTGPRAGRVEQHLAQRHYPVEQFPDGGKRILVNVGSLFPEAQAAPALLGSVMFLRSFAKTPVAEPFSFGMEHFQMLSPLACSMWGKPAGMRMMDLTRMLRGVRCYFLDPGQPDETADLVEQIVSEGA